MSSKIYIDGNVVGELVSEKSGWVTYVDDSGTQRKIRKGKVRIEGQEDNVSSKPKKARKGKAAKGEPKVQGVRKCKEATFTHFAEYVKHKTPSGANSYDNGDKVAAQLRELELDEVYRVVARAQKEAGVADTIGAAEAALRKRYEKLNKGMQRMNLGNRLRALAA